MKYLLFGSYHACDRYARTHNLERKDWRCIQYWDQVAGLNPNDWSAVYLEGADARAVQAWELRMAAYKKQEDDDGNQTDENEPR